MKTKFELKKFMTDNREMVISSWKKLTNEEYYNGIALQSFMLHVLDYMNLNNVKSEKRAKDMLPRLTERVYTENLKYTF